MNNLRKIGLGVVAALLSVGALGLTTPAHADTGWGCPACRTSHG
jgi:hypothetical protein